jgi:hypothetical protein
MLKGKVNDINPCTDDDLGGGVVACCGFSFTSRIWVAKEQHLLDVVHVSEPKKNIFSIRCKNILSKT